MLRFSLSKSSPEAKLAKEMLANGRFENETSLLAAALKALDQKEKQRAKIDALIEEGRLSGTIPLEPLADRKKRLHADAKKRGLI